MKRILLLLILSGCTTDSEKKANPEGLSQSLELIDSFFENIKTHNVKLIIKAENDYISSQKNISKIPIGSVIKVLAKFKQSRPQGTYVFYVKPDTGGYKNAMIFKGYLSGINKIDGVYTLFYIPKAGQMAGTVKIYVFIPGHGTGIANAEIFYTNEYLGR